jgi:hypothetical protein
MVSAIYKKPVFVDIQKDFRAVLDGVADDTDAFQAALDYLAEVSPDVGGTIGPWLGTARITSRLVVKARNTKIVGTGARNCQHLAAVTDNLGSGVHSTIYCDGVDAGFALAVGTSPLNGFEAEGVTLVGNSGKPTAAFLWNGAPGDAFMRDYKFTSCSITRFANAFLLTRESGGQATIAAVRILNCNITYCDYIASSPANDTFFGLFLFQGNDCGQSSTGGGIDISSHAISIKDNILEGLNNPIKVRNSLQSLCIQNNYFEANTGTACIEVLSSWGAIDIGPNVYGTVTTDHKVLVRFTGNGRCLDPYWPSPAFRMPYPEPGRTDDRLTLNNNADRGIAFADVMRPQYTIKPAVTSGPVKLVAGVDGSAPSPIPGNNQRFGGGNMPVMIYTTATTGLLSNTRTLSATAGQWVVANFLFRRMDSSALYPYATLRINGDATTALGSRTFSMDAWSRFFRDKEFCLMTVATKCLTTMTSIESYFYPYGISPPSGLVCQHQRPTYYVVDNVNDIRPYQSGMFQVFDSAPTAGTWEAGDTVWRTGPAVGQPNFWTYAEFAWRAGPNI